jgi:hypothetical protein
MLDRDARTRPSVAEIANCEWLNDPFVRAVQHLDTLSQLENESQVKFLTGF